MRGTGGDHYIAEIIRTHWHPEFPERFGGFGRFVRHGIFGRVGKRESFGKFSKFRRFGKFRKWWKSGKSSCATKFENL